MSGNNNLNEVINIAFGFDHNFYKQAGIAILSLLVFSKDDIKYNIYCLCSNDVSQKDEKEILQIVKTKLKSSEIFFIKVGNFFDLSLEFRGISKAAYHKLFIHKFLPQVDKIIYSDVDILFKCSLSEIWNIPLGENLLGAVKCPKVNQKNEFEEHINKHSYFREHLKEINGKYFNSGLLLMNLNQIRKANLDNKWIEMSRQKYFYLDQDIFNITCKKKVLFLHPQFNVLTNLLTSSNYRDLAIENVFTNNEVKEVYDNPLILHFAGEKPWNNKHISCSDDWWKFVEEYTPYYEYFFMRYQTIEAKQELNNSILILESQLQEIKEENRILLKKNQQNEQEIINRNKEIKLKNIELESKNQTIKSNIQEINSKDNELFLIYSSRAWKLIIIIRKILGFLIPKGSIQRKTIGYVFRFSKNTSTELTGLCKKIFLVLKRDGFALFSKKILELIFFRNNFFYRFKILEIIKFSKKQNKIDFNMGEEKLSVVMLTLNRVNDTRKALKFLYKNIPFDFELIILDNGSDENMVSFLKGLKPVKGNLKIVYEKENLGCAGGRKKAFSLATGDYLLSLDNDIFIMPHSVENLISKLRNNSKMAGCCCKVIFPNGKIQFNGGDYYIQNDLISFSLMDAGKNYNNSLTFDEKLCGWIPGGATLWRKDILEKFKMDPEMKGSYEDNDFAFVLKKEGFYLSNSPKSIAIHNHLFFNKKVSKDLKYIEGRYNTERIIFAIKTFYTKHGLLINDPWLFEKMMIDTLDYKKIIEMIKKNEN